jgi:hypothetical protein
MVFNNNLLLGAAGQSTGQAPFDPTLIGNSIWLDGSGTSGDSATATWGTESNQDRWIWATWYQPLREIDSTGDRSTIFSSGGASNGFHLRHNSTASTFNIFCRDNAGNEGAINTSESYRDLTAWYFILVDFDSANAVATDRISLYVNGVRVGTYSGTSIGQNNHLNTNVSGQTARIGQDFSTTPDYHMKGYLAQTVFLDNKSIANGDLAITNFLDTFTFGTNGSQIVPKSNTDIIALANAAGNNSFCLDYSDGSNIVNDASSKGNNFSTGTIVAANQSSNTPSLNYAVLNILDKGSSATTSEGATRQPTGTDHVILSSMLIPTTGKWAISGRVDAGDFSFGICTPAHTRTSKIGRTNDSWGAIDSPGASFFRSEHDSVATNSTVFSSVNDTFIIAFDADSGKLWLGRNHNGAGIAYLGGGDPTTGTTPTYTLSASEMSPGLHFAVGSRLTVSFGQRTHFETLPTDFLELNSENLTAPDYQGIDYFNATLYTGNGTAIGSGGKAVTGVGFQPDFTWIKNRDAADSHILTDVVRGVTKYISSDSFNAEVTNVESLSTFDTDGFTVGNLDAVNTNTEDYVSWNWLAGGTGSSNTNGSITSTVTVANADHFSIGTYTGTGANATIGHGLGGAPEMIIVKNTGASENWPVYHNGIASDAETDVLFLNNTLAASDSAVYWNDTAPTSSVFTVGTDNSVNASSGTLIFFAFRSVPGVCKVGSYTGNGNADGPFVSLNFNPKLFLLKRTDVANDWLLGYLPNGSNSGEYLFANSNVTGGTLSLDMLSTGIKIRTSGTTYNASGGNYVFLAMADIGGNGTLPPIYGR